ncbi:MAG: polysaccharide biosynthesis tyrosine autokinase [Ruminococcus sp.]|nr:polysaccharide biosynthesis tyrosine autokinase [Ruminococcus sp.]
MREEKTIDLEHINPYLVVKRVMRTLWMPIVTVISVWLLIGACQNLLFRPKYRSGAMMVVTAKNGGSTINSLTTTSDMAKIFADVFQSDMLKNKVAAELGVSKLDGTVVTEAIPETNLFRVSYDADSPEAAFRTLNLIIKYHSEFSEDLFGAAVIEVIKSPNVPVEPINSFISSRRRMLFSIMGGVLVMGIIIFLAMIEDSVQTVSGAKDMIDGKLYSVIPYEKKKATRKKTSILISNSSASLPYVEVFKNLGAVIDHKMRRRRQKVILVSSSVENEGKSTVSSNLALALSERGRSVLLVDCDFRKPAVHKIFDMQNKIEQDLCKYLLDGAQGEYKVSKFGRLDLAISKNGSSNAVKLVHSDELKTFLERMRKNYDYIILDSAPIVIISDTEVIANISDFPLLVVRQGLVPAGVINSCIDSISGSEDRSVGYVLNYYRKFGSSKDAKHLAEHRSR